MSVGRYTGYRTRLYEESPWYAPIQRELAQFDRYERFPTAHELTELHRARVEARGLRALRFVEVPRNKPRRKGQPIVLAELYEGRVIERGEVPTRRDDWHDLFNALAFITFPRAKRALHARQYTIMQGRLSPGAKRLPNARTREQDALALFDEGGLVVVGTTHTGEPELAAEIQAGRACAIPFGHALYEHMVARAPCPLATAFAIAVEPAALSDAWLDALDRALAQSLSAPTCFTVPSPERGVSLAALEPG
jgi:hypothetical protein